MSGQKASARRRKQQFNRSEIFGADHEWLREEMLKTRVAHGYCSRQLAAEACPYANICEQCDNFVTTTEFLPQLQAQLADVKTLRDDAQARGWDTEVARHARVIASIESHIRRLKQQDNPVPDA